MKIIVKHGETLSEIAERETGNARNWGPIAALNKLAGPHLIHAGQQIEIPETMRTMRLGR